MCQAWCCPLLSHLIGTSFQLLEIGSIFFFFSFLPMPALRLKEFLGEDQNPTPSIKTIILKSALPRRLFKYTELQEISNLSGMGVGIVVYESLFCLFLFSLYKLLTGQLWLVRNTIADHYILREKWDLCLNKHFYMVFTYFSWGSLKMFALRVTVHISVSLVCLSGWRDF